MFRKAHGTLVLGLIASGLLAPAALAQSGCDWYAATALKQQQENARLGCGLSGPAWTMDLKGHAKWCASVSPDLAKSEAQAREQQLQACANSK